MLLAPSGTRPGLVLAQELAGFGEAPAVITSDAVLTYVQLAARVDDAAQRLGGGRRLVLIAARNELDALVHHLAALAAGHVVLLAPGDRPHAVDALVSSYDPDVLVRSTGGGWTAEHRHDAPQHELHPDLALLLTTSGTTGSPKLVRLSHDAVQANAEAIATSLGIRADDRAVTTLPLAYSYGLSVVHSHLVRGAAVVLTGLSVTEPCFWDVVRRTRATTLAAVPYTFDLLERVGFAELDLPHLRQVTQAGGKLPPSAVRRWAEVGERRGWDLRVMYGQTEATARIACQDPGQALQRPSSIGRALPGGWLHLTDVQDGVGELVYTGPNVMLGYAASPADLRRGRGVHELRTGDLARGFDDGTFEVVGRVSRLAKVFGQRVDLQHLETALAEDGLIACCLADDTHPHSGGGLLVAVEGPCDEQAVARRVRALTALPAHAVRVVALLALPRLPSGKPDPAEIASAAAQVVAAPSNATDLPAIYARVLGVGAVDPARSFAELGGDSLSYVELSVRLEEVLGHLPTDWHLRPISALAATPAAPRRRGSSVETSVLLRALAILLVVGTHVDLFDLSGGSHVLLAVAGFNVARFALSRLTRSDRLRALSRSALRLAVPSVAWIAFATAVTDDYGPLNIVLLNGLLGPAGWSTAWHFWFLEALVALLLTTTALLALPAVHRLDQRRPLVVPLALLGVGLALRWSTAGDSNAIHTAAGVLWLFALGWAVARASRSWHRVLLTAVLLTALPGFFTDPRRAVFVAAGVTALIWVPTVRLPTRARGPLTVLAGSSLYVYLTHWLVYPPIELVSPPLALVASFAVGIAYWRLCARVGDLMTGITGRTTGPVPDTLVRVP